MGQARLPVRKIREVLRLKADGFSDRQIAAAIGSARSTVQECLSRARKAGVTWPLPAELDEAALHALMYRQVGVRAFLLSIFPVRRPRICAAAAMSIGQAVDGTGVSVRGRAGPFGGALGRDHLAPALDFGGMLGSSLSA